MLKNLQAMRTGLTRRLGACKTALLLLTSTLVLAVWCPAQSLPFNVAVNSTTSCAFSGLSFSAQVTETMSNAKASTYSFQDFVITKVPDLCSKSIYALVAAGTKVPTVVLNVQSQINGSAIVLEQITLSGVVITSLQNGYQNNNLVETLKLSYKTVATVWFNGSAEIKSNNSDLAKGGS